MKKCLKMMCSTLRDKLIIVPAFNEEAHIGATLALIPNGIDVLVVDDGSTDETVERCVAPNIKIVRHEKNLGYECAIGTGIKYFKEMAYRRCIVIDADGEIDVKDAMLLLDNVSDANPVVCGYRINNFGRVSEKIASFFSSRIFGIEDMFCGCKGIHINAVREVPTEIITANAFSKFVAIYSRKNKIMNFPVSGTKREGHSSYGHGIIIELRLIIKLFDNICAYFYKKI